MTKPEVSFESTGGRHDELPLTCQLCIGRRLIASPSISYEQDDDIADAEDLANAYSVQCVDTLSYRRIGSDDVSHVEEESARVYLDEHGNAIFGALTATKSVEVDCETEFCPLSSLQ